MSMITDKALARIADQLQRHNELQEQANTMQAIQYLESLRISREVSQGRINHLAKLFGVEEHF